MRPIPIRQFNDQRTTGRDYVMPAKDLSPVKTEILRGCWVMLRDGEPLVAAKPGQVLTVPRWVADDLNASGQAKFL